MGINVPFEKEISSVESTELKVIEELESELQVKIPFFTNFAFMKTGFAARAKHVGRLCLYDLKLKNIPEKITALSELKQLSLVNCQLSSFPKEILNFSKLEHLYLPNNILTSIPDDIAELKSLKLLSITNNQIHNLPNSIQDIHTLEELYYENNTIGVFPKNVCMIKKNETPKARKKCN